MVRQRDKYDEAIEYLTEHPEKIYDAWSMSEALDSPTGHAGCLFNFAGQQTDCADTDDGIVDCGCLTQIRGGGGFAAFRSGEIDPALSEEIAFDTRIPESGCSIRVEHLPVFAEWQRRLDKELGR